MANQEEFFSIQGQLKVTMPDEPITQNKVDEIAPIAWRAIGRVELLSVFSWTPAKTLAPLMQS